MSKAVEDFVKDKDVEYATLPYGYGLTFIRNKANIDSKVELTWRKMKALFCEHPNKSLSSGYCSYYGEIFYALEEVCEVTSSCGVPSRTSEFGSGYDAIVMGFGHTDCGDAGPMPTINDNNIPLFPILNKEYTGLKQKLEWIKNMKPTAALTVHHDTEEYSKITGIPFHRIMWSANENLFKDYGEDYNMIYFSLV